MRVVTVCLATCTLLVASSSADNIISRMLRQVMPSTMAGVGYDDLTNEAPINDQFGDSNDINFGQVVHRRPQPVRPEARPPKYQPPQGSSSSSNGGGDTSGWNPFTWFAPKLRSIPYNPDTDLTTVNIICKLCFCWIICLTCEFNFLISFAHSKTGCIQRYMQQRFPKFVRTLRFSSVGHQRWVD